MEAMNAEEMMRKINSKSVVTCAVLRLEFENFVEFLGIEFFVEYQVLSEEGIMNLLKLDFPLRSNECVAEYLRDSNLDI
ncbi:hypothetical protein QL285_056209 [Trifolium repens]|nr:hypothetical protein QL285_056209 [Trifolium repens]